MKIILADNLLVKLYTNQPTICCKMILSVKQYEYEYKIDTNFYHDLSIYLDLNSKEKKLAQANSFAVEYAESHPWQSGDFIGDTRRGSPVNFDKVSFIPHCNGTHTECIGHITDQRINFNDHKRDFFSLANLITLKPISSQKSKETYFPKLGDDDLIITKKDLESVLESVLENRKVNYKSLIIRTLPNDESKKTRNYDQKNKAPFFTNEAMEIISDLEIDNLIVDIPSIDRADDDGHLSNHRIWWGLELGSKKPNGKNKNLRTITEFAYIANRIVDDIYILNLQTINFSGDAIASRPIIYPILDEENNKKNIV